MKEKENNMLTSRERELVNELDGASRLTDNEQYLEYTKSLLRELYDSSPDVQTSSRLYNFLKSRGA
jgi:hypothetical protein